MRVQQIIWTQRSGWTPSGEAAANGFGTPSLVLYFGGREALLGGARYAELRGMFPNAHILGCSTGGQINNDDIDDDEVVAAAISFGATRLRLSRQEIADPQHSRACGEEL